MESLAALGIGLIAIVPGYVHYVVRRRVHAVPRLPRLIETIQIVVVGLTIGFVVLLAHGLARSNSWVNRQSVSPAELIQNPSLVLYQDDAALMRVGLWVFALLLIASAVGFVIAYLPVVKPDLFTKAASILQFPRDDGPIWDEVFQSNYPRGHLPYLQCTLTDSTYVAGWLDSYNSDIDESADRDLSIIPPSGSDAMGESSQVHPHMRPTDGRIVVSARMIQAIRVEYVSEEFYYLQAGP